ncbi:MAG TPA: PEP/pyruvate-binding domain-containing protein, partial [Euzebya sp.]|nr:PEP/pyruvate-binding domain-containing protein [Euzebya sp.]
MPDLVTEIIDLDAADALDPSVVGRKAATLARLRAAGFAVPDGAVLPVELCRSWTAGSPPPDPVDAALQTLVRRFVGPVAVRSSAPREDLRTVAHAGEYTTRLHVDGPDALRDAVVACLHDGPPSPSGLALLVQPMLTPDHAGVAFTLDPTTGDRNVVRIAAAPGLGDVVAAGEVVGIDVTVGPDGVVTGDLADLPADHVHRVTRTARQIEDLLGGPQDVEWALVDGEVWVLQARPVTVVPVRPEPPEGYGWEKDVAHYPDTVTPFGYSVLEPAEDAAIAVVFPEIGMLMKRFDQQFVGGEIYIRPVMVVGPADPGPNPGSPPPGPVLGLLARVVPALRRRNAAAHRALTTGLHHRWEARWHREWRPYFLDRSAELGAVDLQGLDDHALLAHGEDCRALSMLGGEVHFKLMIGYIFALHRLHRFTADRLGWDDGRTARLLTGSSPASAESENAMATLRQQLDATPGAREAVQALPHDPVAALTAIAADLAAALQGWIARHAWRSMDYDAGRPVLAEQPAVISRVLLADPDRSGVEDAGVVEAQARAALDPVDLPQFDRLLAEARARYPVREDNVIWTEGMPGGLFRRWLLEAAGRLVDRGVLDQVDDGAYLTLDEVVDALAGGV